MRIVIRSSLFIAALLFMASWATCHFGVEYEISKLPPDHPAHTGDNDWIGVEWIMRAMLIQLAALFFSLMALAAWLVRRKRLGANSVSG